MSQVIIAGDVSGTVTLQAPSTAGTTVLTLPNTSGYVQAPTTVGTSGQLLTSAGGGAPTWSNAPSSAMTLISTKTATGTTGVAWSGLSGYTSYIIIVNRLSQSPYSTPFELVVGSGGTIVTSGYSSGGVSRTNTTVSGVSSGISSYIDLALSNSYPKLFGVINIQCDGTTLSVNANIAAQNSVNYVVSGQVALSSISDIQINNDGNHTFTGGTASLYGISS